METKYYVDKDGNYLGGFLGALPPVGAIEIDAPPAHGLDIYDHKKKTWIKYKEVPQQVTMRQARLALLAAGNLSQVDTAINSLPEPLKSEARIEWEYSGEVIRNKSFVKSLGDALGLSETDLDNLFIEAVKL